MRTNRTACYGEGLALLLALAGTPRASSRPLTPRGLDNVVAFTRLTAYVRFFHPADAVLTTNWDEFTVRGMRLVEQAPTADSLAATLRALFARVAPAVMVYPTGTSMGPRPLPPVSLRTGIVFWQHCGYGAPRGTSSNAADNSRYRSIRRRLATRAGAAPDSVAVYACGPRRTMPVPDPAQPFEAELGGGVSALVPLALFTADAPADSPWRPRPATETFTTRERATRLADVALLWMVPQHFYPYFDVVRVDWMAALRNALREAAVGSGGAAFDGTLERLVAALHDGHGNVFRRSVSLASPDVSLGWIENRVVVTAVGDSASRRGVRLGDEVVAVDGQPIAVALRIAEERTSGATPQWVRFAALRKLSVGAPGTLARFALRDPLARAARPREVAVRRVAGPLPHEPAPDKLAELRPGILYVDLDRVSDDDVRDALPRLAAARGIVIDMRGYPSRVNTPALLAHLTDSAIHSARFEYPLVIRPDHERMSFAGDGWRITPSQPRFRASVVFLTGSGAISYAESTMGVVEENHLGPIVGETTAGTNGSIDPFTLPGGYTVIWTGMRVEKRDGSPHHGVGIRPTVPVSRTLRGVRAGTDEVLARALEVVSAPQR